MIANRWIRLGDEDLAAARKLLAPPDAQPRIACFLLQQAAEKYLKALLAHRGSPLLRTHDLLFLYQELLPDLALSLEQSELLEQMNEFAVALRYYLEVPPPDTIEAVLEYCVLLRAEVIARLSTTLDP